VTLRGPKLIVAALAAAALFWPSTAESPVSAAAQDGSTPEKVTIEHHLVHVPIVSATRLPPRPRLSSANRLASRNNAAERPQNLVTRAGRALLGDGRYRPEPFPRPGR